MLCANGRDIGNSGKPVSKKISLSVYWDLLMIDGNPVVPYFVTNIASVSVYMGCVINDKP